MLLGKTKTVCGDIKGEGTIGLGYRNIRVGVVGSVGVMGMICPPWFKCGRKGDGGSGLNSKKGGCP